MIRDETTLAFTGEHRAVLEVVPTRASCQAIVSKCSVGHTTCMSTLALLPQGNASGRVAFRESCVCVRAFLQRGDTTPKSSRMHAHRGTRKNTQKYKANAKNRGTQQNVIQNVKQNACRGSGERRARPSHFSFQNRFCYAQKHSNQSQRTYYFAQFT
jgi:hypothetical protein